MTDEEINTAIAESLGWTGVHLSEAGELIGKKAGVLIGKKPDSDWHKWKVPNFTGSLDAMHEVVKHAMSELKDLDGEIYFCEGLYMISMNKVLDRNFYDDDEIRVVEATARQRAEAFLRTVGRWEE